MEKLFQKVDTVFVSVENMDQTLKWYRDVLGLELAWQDAYVSILATEGETPVTLMRKTREYPNHPIFNFLTPDIEHAHTHLKEMGVEVEPVKDAGSIKTFDFKDPEGNRLNVCYLKPSKTPE